MAMFKVKVKMTTIGEGIIEGTDKATVTANLNANDILKCCSISHRIVFTPFSFSSAIRSVNSE